MIQDGLGKGACLPCLFHFAAPTTLPLDEVAVLGSSSTVLTM